MKVLRTIAEVRFARAKLGKVALVATMGALHAGHVSLMQVAKKHAPHVAVSLFVNPTQFGPREDYSKYPRPIEEDLRKCEEAGVELVYNPSVEEMYRPGLADIAIDLPTLTGVLEGAKRPGHFKGVCQVVAKLFNILTPDVACFGQKDYQQLRIIAAMVEALDWPIQVVPCPTVREPDGLAMSSRNMYLSAEERGRALAISRALRLAKEQVKAGFRQTNRLLTTMQKTLLEQRLLVDYVAAVDPLTLKNIAEVSGPTLLAIAARVGSARLIDNTIVRPV
ncbi:MAG: pantoate--beta-alanine ligase [Planctomycetota bacterium]|nr:pantoate--beta-alanine ligase [Planctomycetota bacterium]